MHSHWNPCGPNDPTFNIERHLLVFLQENAYYAEISRHLRKVATLDIPTAAVTFDVVNDEFVMYYNPVFFAGGKYTDKKTGEEIECTPLSNWEVRGVVRHEFDHLTFGHLTHRRPAKRELAVRHNIAGDLAINSLIVSSAGMRQEDDRLDARPLPKSALIPGQRPWVDPKQFAALTPERKKAIEEFSDIIEKFPKDQATEFYFNKLNEIAQKKQKQSGGSCDADGSGFDIDSVLGTLDDHDGWDDVPDDQVDYVEGKIKAMVEKAVANADGKPNGWGSIPVHIQAEIRRSISTIVDWRAVLRQFVGSLMRGERTTSIKRINRRYPYIHPGVKRGYTARILVAIDQSGSVDDGQMSMFFDELATLTKRVGVDILPFDCGADVREIFEWKKGTNPKIKRTRMGGTDFNAPSDIVNDVKNRGRWDGYLIMTDGECSAPRGSRVKRGWVLSKGHKLLFNSDELQVYLDDTKPMTGAWR
jgi:predicted metal-dependent peptidase